MKKIITFTMAFAAIISMTVLSSCSSGTPTPQEEADKVIANYKAKPAKEISPIFGNYYNLINDEKGLGNILYVERINCDNPEDGILQKRAEAYEIVKGYFQPLIAKEKESIENRTDIPFGYNKERFSEAEIRIDNISEKEIDFSGTFTYIPTYTRPQPRVDAIFLKSDGSPAHNNEFDSRFNCKLERIEGDKYSYKFTLKRDGGYQSRVIDNAEKIELLWVR